MSSNVELVRSEEDEEPHGYGEQLREMLKLVWPLSLSQILEQFVFTLTAMFTGHLGKNQLDALALGNTAVNVTGLSVAIGVNTACDTLFSQTSGSKNRNKLGILLQKALVINIFIIIPCAALFLNMDYIFEMTGQDPLIAKMAGHYTALSIPGLVFSSLMMVLYKYLACQHIVRPTLVIMLVMNVLHYFFLQLFLHRIKLDIAGTALAMNLTFFSGTALHVMYIFFFRVYKETWTGWSLTCLLEWTDFIRLAMYGLLMTCLSWWCLEVYMVLAGLLGTVELGAHYIAMQIVNMLQMTAYGISSAVNVRVGNLVGRGDHVTARKAARVGMVIACVVSLTSSSFFLAFGHLVPKVFTNDREVIALVSKLVPYMALYMFSDVLRSVVGSILRGIGRQRFGAIVAFVAVYAISLPLGVVCMFATSLGLFGVWIGISASEIIRGIAYFARVLTINWQKETELAELRTRIKGTPNRDYQEYQQLSTDDSSSNEHEMDVDDNHNGKVRGEDHVPRTLRRAIVTRVVTLCGLLVILTIGIILHTLNIYEGGSLSNSNATIP